MLTQYQLLLSPERPCQPRPEWAYRVGDLTLENRLGGFHRELAEALLSFADFAGVGIKTTLGMGGVEHIPLL